MALRTGKQFLEALKDGRQIFIDGERVADVTKDRRLAAAAHSVAELYDMQHDAKLTDQMSFVSPSSGERIGLSFIEPRSVDDLIRRRGMVKVWMDATCGMFGRSPDFLNIMLTGLAAAAPEFGKQDKRFADNVRAYHVEARERDLCMTHTLLNPQVDRSRPVERQEKDLAAKIVKETDAGIVIDGARMVSTLCAYSDDILVMPSTFLATNADAAPYAFGFSIPVASPGLRFICRPSVVHQNAASPMDFPLSSRLDEGDGLAVFDNVLVPWERVFIHRDPEMCNGLFQRTQAMPQVMHQTSTKNLAKAEFMMALGFAIARSTNIDAHLHVQGMLAELIEHVEFVRSCIRASEADAAVNKHGIMTPAEMPLWTVRMMFPKMFVRACEIIQLMGAGGLVAVPSYAELSGPAAADVEKYAQAANADAPTRVKLFRLAFDAAVSSFSGRQQLYERYYSGDPVRLAGALYALYDKEPHVARIHGMLNEIEARAKA
ncbi:MAG TPA: 4-hydroxyphenylacetate 3-monooxygenase, oxygenase component [Stellaceae bacterium]|jgi:4-hydroxyphenylacetate 3-monooxygenase|nr:4-hydroxyphenylacetate 3-monooxygenase, oxygenase component [Stellaceae bacterium]